MAIDVEAAVKNRTTSLAETVIHTRDYDWAGSIDYQLYIRTVAVLGSATIIFRWLDRAGTARNHTASGLTLLATGIVANTSFNLWTQAAANSTISLEIILVGITGNPAYDFFANGRGVSYGS